MMYEVAGGGIAVIDVDLDGWNDLYFSQAGGQPYDAYQSDENRLYRNLDGKAFVDIGSQSAVNDRGYGQGVTAVDINQDGFKDLITANYGANILSINNGDGTFTSTVIGESQGWTTSVVCGDVDGDHVPELIEINYMDDPKALIAKCWGIGFDCSVRSFKPGKTRVLKVSADGDWQRWEVAENIKIPDSYGFAAIISNFADVPGNGIFVSNDTRHNRFIPVHKGNRAIDTKLSDQGELRGCAVGADGSEQGSMGIACGDFDRDGSLDLCITNFWDQPSNLYLQRSPGFFKDFSEQFGISRGSRMTVGFGIQAPDLNHDGYQDLVVLNGHVFNPKDNGTPDIPFRMFPQLFRGGANGFREQKFTGHAHETFWTRPTLGRTLAVVDYNNDGALDLVANHLDADVALLENQTSTKNHLRLNLIGVTSERDATGAKVVVKHGDETVTSWVYAGGYLCSSESTLSIGINDSSSAASVEIVWPTGHRQRFENVAANASYLVVESADKMFKQ
jgi:hypothetical protein